MELIKIIAYVLLAIGTLTVPMYVLSQKINEKTGFRNKISRRPVLGFIYNFFIAMLGISSAWVGYNLLAFEATFGAGLIGIGMGVMMFITTGRQKTDNPALKANPSADKKRRR